MDEKTAARLLIENGKQLLSSGLVARTWGNISCRLDDQYCAITPSGLDYNSMKEENIVKLNITTGEWKGRFKPSGEKGVHTAAYETFKDVNFVIHTHQDFATAIGLAGFGSLDITEEEAEALGGVGIASYGLSGTKKLSGNVKSILQAGMKTVLMPHHGVLVCGGSRDETMERAVLLEKICERNTKGIDKRAEAVESLNVGLISAVKKEITARYKYADVFATPSVGKCAEEGIRIYAQVDDMAQMMGRVIPIVSEERAADVLKKYNAVLIKGVGAAVRGGDEDDMKALKLLTDKACTCFLHTAALGEKARLGMADTLIMNYVYRHKYSKQKSQEEI